jgi:hypothetical protein
MSREVVTKKNYRRRYYKEHKEYYTSLYFFYPYIYSYLSLLLTLKPAKLKRKEKKVSVYCEILELEIRHMYKESQFFFIHELIL